MNFAILIDDDKVSLVVPADSVESVEVKDHYIAVLISGRSYPQRCDELRFSSSLERVAIDGEWTEGDES